MDTTYDTFTHADHVIEMHYDLDAQNPRTDYDNITVIACRNDHRSYTFGDEAEQFDLAAVHSDAYDEWAEANSDEDGNLRTDAPAAAPSVWAAAKARLIRDGAHPGTLVGLSIIDHSGLSLQVDVGDGSAACAWDGAFIGWAYMTRDAVEAEVAAYQPDAIVERARQIVISDAKTYGSYLAGDCVGWVVKDAEGEVVDSCWGYLGDEDYARSEARGAAEAAQKAAAEVTASREAEIDAWATLCGSVA